MAASALASCSAHRRASSERSSLVRGASASADGFLGVNPSTLRVLKTVRIYRLLRLVRHLPQLRTLLVATFTALPAFRHRDAASIVTLGRDS